MLLLVLDNDRWLAAFGAGLTISNVQAIGHRFTTASDISRALALDATATQLSFDGAAARDRLEQLPWIETATIQRVLPDGLTIAVTERTPYAVWRRPGRDVLVDVTGRELGDVSPGGDLALPVLAGEGAGPRAVEILALVARHDLIANRLVVAHRIADRRWRLELTSGARIELPAEGAAAALARLSAQIPADRLARALDGALESIDLRTAPSIVVRRRIEPPQSRAGQTAASGARRSG